MSEPGTKKSWPDSFRIHDRESCARAIRNGGIAAVIVAALSLIFGVAGFFRKSGNPQLDYVLDPSMLWDAGLVAILAFFVFRRSRVASTLLVVHLVAGKAMMWIDTGSLQGLPRWLPRSRKARAVDFEESPDYAGKEGLVKQGDSECQKRGREVARLDG